jgi:hypothetical protein
MISEQVKQRDKSFYLTAMIVGLFGFAIFIGEHFFKSPDSITVTILVTVVISLIAIGNIFLFKGFYHWSKAKGYPGNYCLLVFLGPLGLFILYRLVDLTSEKS